VLDFCWGVSTAQMYDLDFKTKGNDGSQKLSGAALTDLYKDFLAKYPVVSIEDPFDQVCPATTTLFTHLAAAGTTCGCRR
jgi:enolase